MWTFSQDPAAAPETGRMIAAEFFAGIGLARIGLEQAGFEVAWSNDIDQSKRDMYCGHFRDSPRRHRYQLADVASVSAADLPEGLALAWASFPCVDVSLAGWRRGFRGSETSTFWQFARVMDALGDARPPVVALENVLGLATSHKGQDLRKAIAELNRLGYVVDVLAVDALRFVPQSRQRLFLVGMLRPPAVEAAPADARDLRPAWLDWVFDDASLHTVRAALPEPPPLRGGGFAEVAERLDDADERWWDSRRVKAFEASLSPLQAQRLDLLRERAEASLRTAYRRTRHGVARWEIRADDVAGCLRTARGGSSRQAVAVAGGGALRVRWMTPREYARLMGAPDYRIDQMRDNQAYFGFGDGVCVPAVSWLARSCLVPAVAAATRVSHRP